MWCPGHFPANGLAGTDEVAGISFDQKDGVNIMKGYMASGGFSRGKESIRAEGSLVLVGNFDVPVDQQQRIGHLERAIHRAASHAQRAADFLVIKTVAGRVQELAERPLDDRAWIVVYLDVVEIGQHPLVGAVGVDTEGTKRVLGLRLAEGDPDDRAAAAEELLRDAVGRGLPPDRRRLVVTDGSDLFTVDRFGLDPGLARSLVTTGLIDFASSGLPLQVCGVPSWGDGETVLAWAAASFLDTERGYMKVRGHRRLHLLRDHLDQIEMPLGP